ncbi:hypothetical protein [Micromonospora auratinigra]|uniref:Uncharacterized protein n=1 Tax=Micromonospora auratinigra TaxID=261654 RepID=A0A1A8ZI49_9ACTN|nr:hypothetical protein [Micromonospora auratinigra]SBT43508.1 hypothetical protein GA0070611_2345 [Micromonospora auratinigra]
MRWLQRLLGGNKVRLDPARQQALVHEVRQRFGAHAPEPFPAQVEAITGLLKDDDGLVVASLIVGQVAEEAHADLRAQADELHRRTGRRLLVHRRNYRPLWKEAGPGLRWPLFALPCGFHPYAQLTAAVTAVGDRAARIDRVVDPGPLLTGLFEILDLTTAGWEYGRVPVDVDAATLADRLIGSTGRILTEVDDPPRLPPPVRELMRRNDALDVAGPGGPRPVGRINLGATMRERFLV